ncbi:radical SAM protein [Methanoculleus sp. FWC-SCC1]|uniref:Radical SAM protein n=1 Tax=Methanoculleus frigidifontis TaxID=2584085 RepID=A0ABT8ME67_9EURY|nr:radical SAM protein [Methanoculleus sp. FWC-SCC1]MDN7026235.1 radical SAM protein [Methanoculleus sp. FWC-SCC1]
MDFHITNACNLRCIHCYAKAGKEVDEPLKNDEIFRILSEAKDFGISEVHLEGGEPLLRNDLKEICLYAKKIGLVTTVCTNGTLLDRNLLDFFKRVQLDGLFFTVFSLDNKIHDGITQIRGSHEKTIRALKLSIGQGIRIGVFTPVCRKNLDGIRCLTEHLSSLGVHFHAYIHMSPVGRGSDIEDLILNAQEWIDFTDLIMESSGKYNLEMKLESFAVRRADFKNAKNKRSKCKANDVCFLHVLASGEVYPCPLLIGNNEYLLGNLRISSFSSILEKLKGINVSSEYCTRCDIFDACGGGCIAYREISKLSFDPRCKNGEYILSCPTYISSFNNAGE